VCLVYQLASNFAFLSAVDRAVFGDGAQFFTIITAVIWMLYLASISACPRFVRLCSVAAISVACGVAPYVIVRNLDIYIYSAFLAIWAQHLVMRKQEINRGSALIALSLIVRAALLLFLPSIVSIVITRNMREVLVVYYAVLMCLLCTQNDPVASVVIVGSIGGTALSAILSEEVIFLHSCAFTAMLMQGLAHEISEEKATILALQGNDDQRAKVSYELAHVTYFPNMVFHAIYNSLGEASI